MRPRVVVDRGMITIDPRREDGAGVHDMRHAVAEIAECLSLCPPVESSEARDVPDGDGRHDVVLCGVPTRVLPALVALLEREGWQPPPWRRPSATAKPTERVRPSLEDEARVRAARALSPGELRRWARTGELPDLVP